jgi:ribosome-associated toxin RatA of RatAB toxin-antitoxin module
MPVAKTKLETFVPPDELRAVLLAFEKYPEFLPEVAKIEVTERTESSALVKFHVAIAFAGLDVKTDYTVRYAIAPREITWKLVSSPSVTKNEGSWKLEETKDGETVAHYEATVETNLQIAPDIQAAFVQESLPKLMERFRDRAEEM